MSCCDNNNLYSQSCCPDTPYPNVQHESVPSLIDNLVLSLYGEITKTVSGGRVVWNIPCDPSQSPAEVPTIPRNAGEGLLCYIMRVFQNTVGQFSPFQFWSFTGNASTTSYQLPPSNNTLASSYLVYINGIVQPPAAYNISNTSPVNIIFQSPPANGAAVTVVNLGYTPPFVIDVTQSEATPTNSAITLTIGQWLATLLQAISNPTGGTPQGGIRWSLVGNNITTTIPLIGATSTNPNSYLVAIDGVVQDPASYTINTASLPYTLVMPSPILLGSTLVAISINSPVSGWYSGAGSPNGIVTAPIGSLYSNTAGGANQTLWVKESGTGNTGWVAK